MAVCQGVMVLIFCLTFSLLHTATSDQVVSILKWVSASEGTSRCDTICSSQSMSPVASGTYTNGNKYWVCAGNTEDEGYRVGFNLRPSWTNGCTVAYGGGAREEDDHMCLCQKNFTLEWVDAGEDQSCSTVCTNSDKKPVRSGQYTVQNQPFYVCRANYNSDGHRPGFQIPYHETNKCVMEHGDAEVTSDDKSCLCY